MNDAPRLRRRARPLPLPGSRAPRSPDRPGRRPELLIVDDEEPIRFLLEAVLTEEGYDVVVADGVARALELVAARGPSLDALLVDLRLGDGSGLDVLGGLRAAGHQDVPAIVVTAFADLAAARAAMQLGARDLITKPFDNAELQATVRRWVRPAAQRPAESGAQGLLELMGPCAARGLDALVTRVARSSFSVVITGETGTGKELVARAVHARSPRSAGPFVPVDCGAITEGLAESELFGHERGAFTGADRRRVGCFERAHGGTIFLDEVENLAPSVQARLLRALQEREIERLGGEAPLAVDVRVVAATNVPLEGLVAGGQLRADLYHRLAESLLELPPLRERRADIAGLARRFLGEAQAELARALELGLDAIEALEAYAWPGNVRELRNVVRRAALHEPGAVIHREPLDQILARAALVGPARASPPPGGTLREVVQRVVAEAERTAISDALARTHGNKSEAARQLGCDWKTLALKCQAYAITTRADAPARAEPWRGARAAEADALPIVVPALGAAP